MASYVVTEALSEQHFNGLMQQLKVAELKAVIRALNGAPSYALKPQLRQMLQALYTTDPLRATIVVLQHSSATFQQAYNPANMRAQAQVHAQQQAARVQALANAQAARVQDQIAAQVRLQATLHAQLARAQAAQAAHRVVVGGGGSTSPRSVPAVEFAQGFSSPLAVQQIHQLNQLQLDAHQSLMEHCRIIGSVLVDKLAPRVNGVRTYPLQPDEIAGLQPQGTHLVKCRFVLFNSETRQFTLPSMWPAGCSLRINDTLVFDTCQTPASLLRPSPAPLPLIDISLLPRRSPSTTATSSSEYHVTFSAQRKATNMQWYVVVFTLRKKPQQRILDELLAGSPAVEVSRKRMLDSFESEVACVDPVLLKLRDPVSMGLITVPVRTQECSHLQCFDFFTHVEINTKARSPKWRCPMCSKSACVKELVMDRWFGSLLEQRTLQARTRCFQVKVSPPNDGSTCELTMISSEEEEEGGATPQAKRQQLEHLPAATATPQHQQQPAAAAPSPFAQGHSALHYPTAASVSSFTPSAARSAPPPPARTPPRLGNSREQAIELLDDDDDLF